MKIKAILTVMCAVATAAVMPTTASAQAFPTKPVTLVIPFAAGGPTDLLGRALAQSMAAALGTSVIVENRTGAGGTVAGGVVARAQADGHTLLLHHIGMSTAPGLYRKLAFDPMKDFEHIGQVADVPMTVIGRPGLPAKTPQELIAWMQKEKQTANLAHAGLGAASQLCGMLLQQSIGAQSTTVPFQGTAPALTALLGGQVDVMCDQTTQTIPHIKGGKVQLYAVTTPERLKPLPDTLTLREAGLKNFEVVVWHGLYAPKGTPAPVLAALNTALRKSLKDPALVKRLDEVGVQVVAENLQTPDGLRNHLKSEIDRWGALIRQAGTYAD
ncbi:tripartite tricarboxylate transporter substrate-binding protein [Pseudorhodoferax sp. Leaf274]|uniref:tripartite tricarboxylate transporter substrate-binding protein n=1 Tax=Pseudorhodoferax sp. Leaf274 TaxID=1736318 RepID=UPI0007039A3F|nr:tripartite tricarboxylate transporter substrate-binding protein [Pseudorhodoferax sp. Leaf274]KQP35405.1 ABC transporter substrate-binding protein [Pseudorhodoferax sp. Leaf274]